MVKAEKDKVYLIIPDIHHKWRQAERIISSVGADEIIFLGDYYDDFNDDINMVEETCDWFAESTAKPNRIHLWGNHDVHYGFPHRVMRCSGYADWKFFKIRDKINEKVWKKLKFYHVLDNMWLLSHAGIHKSFVPQPVADLRQDRVTMFAEFSKYLDEETIKCLRKAAKNGNSWMFSAGRSRGGFNKVGGITWCDYQDEFHPSLGLNQIVGHTPSSFGCPIWTIMGTNYKVSQPLADMYTPTRFNDPDSSVNLGLDVFGIMRYAVWDGKNLTLGSYSKL